MIGIFRNPSAAVPQRASSPNIPSSWRPASTSRHSTSRFVSSRSAGRRSARSDLALTGARSVRSVAGARTPPATALARRRRPAPTGRHPDSATPLRRDRAEVEFRDRDQCFFRSTKTQSSTSGTTKTRPERRANLIPPPSTNPFTRIATTISPTAAIFVVVGGLSRSRSDPMLCLSRLRTVILGRNSADASI